MRPGREWLPVETGIANDDGSPLTVPVGSVGKYLDEFFADALDLYNTTELFECLPFAGGWAEQPWHIYRVLKILKNEAASWESEQLEKSKKK